MQRLNVEEQRYTRSQERTELLNNQQTFPSQQLTRDNDQAQAELTTWSNPLNPILSRPLLGPRIPRTSQPSKQDVAIAVVH